MRVYNKASVKQITTILKAKGKVEQMGQSLPQFETSLRN